MDPKDFSKKVRDKLQKALNALSGKGPLLEIGQDVADQIKLRTRLGEGVDKDGKTYKLSSKPLSEPYKEFRKTFPNLSPETKPNKSNLTLTGEMLDDIKVSVEGKKIRISLGSQLSKDKRVWNEEKGRSFFYLTPTNRKRVKLKLKEILLKNIKKK